MLLPPSPYHCAITAHCLVFGFLGPPLWDTFPRATHSKCQAACKSLNSPLLWARQTQGSTRGWWPVGIRYLHWAHPALARVEPGLHKEHRIQQGVVASGHSGFALGTPSPGQGPAKAAPGAQNPPGAHQALARVEPGLHQGHRIHHGALGLHWAHQALARVRPRPNQEHRNHQGGGQLPLGSCSVATRGMYITTGMP
jgi:hypothetical protein